MTTPARSKAGKRRKTIPRVARIDHKRTRGWAVKFTHRDGRRAAKLFSDGRYGGKGKALAAAVAYRDECERRGLIRPHRNRCPRSKHARNTTGCVGVCPVRHKGELRGYAAYWQEDGLGVRRVFTVAKYGRRAMAEAVACRKRSERRLRAAAGGV